MNQTPADMPQEEFWHNLEPNFKDFYSDLHKHVSKMGWKDVFFSIMNYQKSMKNETPYNFDKTREQR